MSEVKITTTTVADVMSRMVGHMTANKLKIMLDAVNANSTEQYTGVWNADMDVLSGSDHNALRWEEFLAKEVKVGNINM